MAGGHSMVRSYTDQPVSVSNSSEIDAGTKLADNLTSYSDVLNAGEIDAGVKLAETLIKHSVSPGSINSTLPMDLDCLKLREVRFRNGSSNSGTLFIPINLQGVRTDAVVDSAAQVTEVSRELWEHICETPPSVGQVVLCGADNASKMKADIVDGVSLQVGGHTYPWRICVASISDKIILGMDFLRATHCLVDLEHDCLTIDKEVIPGMFQRQSKGSSSHVSQVKVSRRVIIPPNTTAAVSVSLANPEDGRFIIQPQHSFGLMVPHSLVCGKGNSPIMVCNFSSKFITLKKGHLFGEAVEVESALEDEFLLRRTSTAADGPPGQTEFNKDSSHVLLGSKSQTTEVLRPDSEVPNEDANQQLADSLGVSEQTRGSAIHMPPHLKMLYYNSLENLVDSEAEQLAQLLIEYQDVFSTDDFDLGCFKGVSHRIDTDNARPIRQRMRRTPLGFAEEEEAHLKKMLDCGVIQPSNSEWASPPVLVRKKDGTVRWCIDYRALNNVTIKDAYPLPLISECLDTLSGTNFFSTLDLASGYWQIELAEGDRQKTAFITKHGLFEHTRMGFGLCNAPSTFQRAMEMVLQGMTWKEVICYLDDVIVVGNCFGHHLNNLREVFARCRKHNMKLKPKKCELFRGKVIFLGKLVTAHGVSVNPANLHVVQNWKVPGTVTEVESFLGLINYHRDHLRGYAEIAAPLYQLTGSKGRAGIFEWGPEHKVAFDTLIASMTSAPVLGFPKPDCRFILDTDASDHSIGAELLQLQDGGERAICYGSYVLTPAQRRYCTTRKELLAVVRFTRQFRHYLLGRRFTLRTDHSSLSWLLGFKNIEGQLSRWLEELSQYDMEVIHRPGALHIDADSLSRIPDTVPYCHCYLAGQDISTLPCGGCSFCTRAQAQWSRFEDDVDDIVPLALRAVNLDQAERESSWFAGYTPGQLRDYQFGDPTLTKLLIWAEGGPAPTEQELMLSAPATKHFWLNKGQLCLSEGVLHYKWEAEDGSSRLLLVVPGSLTDSVLKYAHDCPTSGHFASSKTLSRLKQGYIWYNMREACEQYTKSCDNCSKNKKATVRPRGPLGAYHAGLPMERVHVDILGPFSPPSTTGNQYVLMIVDQFTKWIECFLMAKQTAQTVAQTFVEGFISRMGSPLQVHTDQGRQFEGTLFQAVCDLLGIVKTRTTPYHPCSNSQVERYNRTLLQLIRCFLRGNMSDWDRDLQLLAGAIRAVKNRSTGYTANMMMLGREVIQPIDLVFGASTRELSQGDDPVKYVGHLRETLQAVHTAARETLKSTQTYQKRTYDLRQNVNMFEPGDLVYELNSSTKVGRSSKLQPVWKGPLLVTKVKQPTLYKIADRKRSRWVHHDRLKTCTDRNVPIWIKRLRNRLFAALEVPSSQPNEKGDAIGGQVSSDSEATGLEDISTLFTPPPP